MSSFLLAIMVGALFMAGTYLILRRGQIKLILGIGLLSHGVHLLLFGSGVLTRGNPPIILDPDNYIGELANNLYADPLPQALILTAIVISFGITAFIIVLVSRRQALTGSDVMHGELAPYINADDPFDVTPIQAQIEEQSDHDYDLLQYERDEIYN